MPSSVPDTNGVLIVLRTMGYPPAGPCGRARVDPNSAFRLVPPFRDRTTAMVPGAHDHTRSIEIPRPLPYPSAASNPGMTEVRRPFEAQTLPARMSPDPMGLDPKDVKSTARGVAPAPDMTANAPDDLENE